MVEADIKHLVSHIAGIRYGIEAERMGNPHFDMSRIGDVRILSYYVRTDIESGHRQVSRELHVSPTGRYNFLLVHAAPNQARTDEDLVTDLVPWGFAGGEQYTGHLHGTRSEVRGLLFAAGAPAEWIALRGLDTITRADYAPLELPPSELRI